MAQNRNAPGTGAVPDPGGLRYPVNTASAVGVGNNAASAAPGAPSGGVSRPGATIPLNSAQAQSVGAPAPWAAPVSGSFPTVSTVSDPGASRFAVGQQQAIGYREAVTAPGGGDPSALGTNYSAPDADAPTWSQFNISGNPNPGALQGGTGQIQGLYPGETPANQVSPEANPNPGGL